MLMAQNLKRALVDAAACAVPATSLGVLHRNRSSAWVSCLAGELGRLCTGQGVEIFTAHDRRNKALFGSSELLYDISICGTATLPSPGRGSQLHCITKALWQVESELETGNSRAWVQDFNKLVVGAAENKLFVGPAMRDVSRDSILPIARCCSGRVFFATIPHPREWDGSDLDVLLWKLSNDRWEPVGIS